MLLFEDPSMRHAGMGGVTTGVFWTGGEGTWGNPAALGSLRGLQYAWARLQRESLGNDDFLRAERLRAGGFGIGVEFGGEPSDRLGFTHFDYGDPVGGLPVSQDIDSWAIGIDAVELVAALMRLAGTPSKSLASTLAVNFGYAEEAWSVSGGGEAFPEFDVGPVRFIDRGLRVRFCPYNSIDRAVAFGGDERRSDQKRLRFDVAYGYCRQNSPDQELEVLLGTGRIAPSARHGLAARLALGYAPGRRDRIEAAGFGWILGPETTPLLAVGIAWDRETFSTFEPKSHFGLELTLAAVLALRLGYRHPRGSPSVGLGVGIHALQCVELRYDFAWPQSESLSYGQGHAIVATIGAGAIGRAVGDH
jgi:hypothetical protein